MFNGVDELRTQLNTKLTIGDGGLFSQPFQNVVNSEAANEYGSSESMRSVVSTPAGLFYISQAQGKIFQYTGRGLEAISNAGMKWWFNKYLPSSLIKQYPELEFSKLADNPVVGIGCQTVYDINDDIVYFMKKDFKVKSEWVDKIKYEPNDENPLNTSGFKLYDDPNLESIAYLTIGDPTYFDDCCWTVSYDPKAKAWISFHDWCPELSLPSINHFFTTKTKPTDVAQCPPGYNYNPSTQLCEKIEGESTPAEVTVLEEDVDLQRTGCPLDVVFTLDASTAAGDPTDPASSAYAQISILSQWLQDSETRWLMSNNHLQVGILLTSETTPDHAATTFFDFTPVTGVNDYSMSRELDTIGKILVLAFCFRCCRSWNGNYSKYASNTSGSSRFN